MPAPAIRFAAGPILKGLKNILVPMTQAGKPAYGQLAARYAPDLLYSGLASTMAPPGATGADRLGIAAEDLGIGLVASVLGQVAGGGVANKLRFAGKALTPEAKATAATLGDVMVGAPVNMFAPRPVYSGVVERALQAQEPNLSARKQEALQTESQQEMTKEQAQQELISLLLGAGITGGRALS